jgi:glycogen debranching enzyme
MLEANVALDGLHSDGAPDRSGRSNVFLAWYAFPGLIPEDAWRSTFARAIGALWLEWGGLSSVAKDSVAFRMWDSGEDTSAYHRGDSWYFVNNIAAIALHEHGFFAQANALLRASVRDLLDEGVAGHASEISSAGRQEAMGCHAQAWSASTLLEALLRLRIRTQDVLS